MNDDELITAVRESSPVFIRPLRWSGSSAAAARCVPGAASPAWPLPWGRQLSNTRRPIILLPSIAARPCPARLTEGWTLPQRRGQIVDG
jgi:hypothetical protein